MHGFFTRLSFTCFSVPKYCSKSRIKYIRIYYYSIKRQSLRHSVISLATCTELQLKKQEKKKTIALYTEILHKQDANK